MDAQIISSLINLAGGALGLSIIQGVVKWVRGHYNALQKAEDKYKTERNLKGRWIEHAIYLRHRLVELGVNDLPPRPDDQN